MNTRTKCQKVENFNDGKYTETHKKAQQTTRISCNKNERNGNWKVCHQIKIQTLNWSHIKIPWNRRSHLCSGFGSSYFHKKYARWTHSVRLFPYSSARPHWEVTVPLKLPHHMQSQNSPANNYTKANHFLSTAFECDSLRFLCMIPLNDYTMSPKMNSIR